MSTEDRKSGEQQDHKQGYQQKKWDERPGQRDSDPIQQQRQREWEEAQKNHQQNATRPRVGKSDLKQHDRRGNPTDRGDLQAE